MECAKVLLAFGAKVDASNAFKKTPLDLVEGPWRFFCRHDSNHAIGSFPSHSTGPFDLESLKKAHTLQSSHSPVNEYINMEYAPDKARDEFIHTLKSLGAKRGRDVRTSHHAPVEVHPGCGERLSRSSHWQHEQSLYAKKLMASIHSSQEDVKRVLSSSDLDGMSASDAIILGKRMQRLKSFHKAGSRILCLDGGGMRL